MTLFETPELQPYDEIVIGAITRLCGTSDVQIVAAIASSALIRKLHVGDVLYRQGDSGDSMHIVLSGRLQVSVRSGEREQRTIAYPQPGDVVGEMALLSGAARAATVVAARDTTLAEICRDDLDTMIKVRPDIFSNIARMIIERLSGLQGRIAQREGARSFLVVPLHDEYATRRFADRLRQGLLRHGSVLLLDAPTAASRFGHSNFSIYGTYLDRCEAEYEFVILIADQFSNPWTRTCLGYADSLLLVADARRSPELSKIEQSFNSDLAASRSYASRELVLIHPSGAKPRSTAEWLKPRSIRQHFHVREGNQDDVDRTARFISGHAIGLVLAGGGARGFAHMGVIRALQESGIPIDAIGGASFGALVATGPARQMAHEVIFAEQHLVFSDGDPLRDYTFPVVSLVRGEHLDGILRERLGENIEDLFIPFFAVSSDLSANKVRVHDRGPLWRAVRASISLPAILPPTLEDGHLLVDGGVLNNLPVDVLRERMRGPIIAVDLANQQKNQQVVDRIPSSTEYLKSKFLPGREVIETPTLSRIILQVTTLASRKEVHRARSIADLYLNPPTSEYDFLDWGKMREIAQVGYESSLPDITNWLAANPLAIPIGRHLSSWLAASPPRQ